MEWFFYSFLTCKMKFIQLSLQNYSNGIRWSVDFRFKKTGLPNGMHGLKNDVILRSSNDPDMKIDWSMFNAVERLKIKKNSDGSIVDVSKNINIRIHDLRVNTDKNTWFTCEQKNTWFTCASLYIYCTCVIIRVVFVFQRNDNDFDTTISGPWIRKWELVHSNRHTDQAWKEYM